MLKDIGYGILFLLQMMDFCSKISYVLRKCGNMSEDILVQQLFEIVKDKDMDSNIKVAKIDMLIKLGISVDCKNENGSTALMSACQIGDLEIIDFLIKKGANINSKNGKGHTALMVAANGGDLKVSSY